MRGKGAREITVWRLMAPLCLLAMGGLGTSAYPQSPPIYGIVPGCDDEPEVIQAIGDAVTAAVVKSRPPTTGQTWQVHSICRQGGWAYTFVKGYSPATGLPLPQDSTVVLSRQSDSGWQSWLPESGEAYLNALAEAPAELLPAEARPLLAQRAQNSLPAARTTFFTYSGYYLPYPGGQSAYVIKHWYPAVDFTIIEAPQGKRLIRNAKAGKVLFVKDSSSRLCGDPPADWTCWQWANTLVIETGPDEYVWYMHFSANSIPDWIQEGTYVAAGVDLGEEGATGWASSPHLHFMVASSYSCCQGDGDSRIPYWPASTHRVDFAEYKWSQLPWRAYSQNGVPPVNQTPQIPADAPPNRSLSVSAPAAPTPPAVQPPAATGGLAAACPNPYTVRRGDWLYQIAAKCGVTFGSLLAANPRINPDFIVPGQQLQIPAADRPVHFFPAISPPAADVPKPTASGACRGEHIVAAGENLFRIGYNCGYSTEQMARANGLRYPYIIYPGQHLRYPED